MVMAHRPAAAMPSQTGADAVPAASAALAAWSARHPDLTTGTLAVAYSGGADSTALLLAAQAAFPGRVQALHIDHGLQAAAADFASHARTFCAERGLALTVERVQAAHAPGESPEEAARHARYLALATLARRLGCGAVLLGQHAQDQAETLLLALSRGAGLAGLAGMPERFTRHGMVFGRPLLAMDAAVLRAELQAPYVDDPTNTDTRYTRNRIRLQVLPALQQAFPQFADTLARSARHAAQAQALLDELAQADLSVCGQPPRLAPLQALSRARQANLLRHWLRLEGSRAPSEAQLNECLDQIAACRTRGHRIELKVADGWVLRSGPALCFQHAAR